MKFEIPCSWQMYGTMEIEADTLKEAIQKANDDSSPLPDGDFVTDSFQVDWESIEENYKTDLQPSDI